MTTAKPADVYDRDDEWAFLGEFASLGTKGPNLGVVYGRRRQGKTFLLHRFLAAGRARMAFMHEVASAATLRGQLVAVSKTIGEQVGAPVAFDSWREVFEWAFAEPSDKFVVLDEFQRVIEADANAAHDLQEIYDRHDHRRLPGGRLILCGSAFGTMASLGAANAPLYGRGTLRMQLAPFDYRISRRFHGIDNFRIALFVHAVVGGTPGNYDPTSSPPRTRCSFEQWLCRTVLNRDHALFGEPERALSDEGSIRDRSLYLAALAAVAQGATKASEIGGRIGRRSNATSHVLERLCDLDLMVRLEDPLRPGRPQYRLTDPLLRFGLAIVHGRDWHQRLCLGQRADVWAEAKEVFYTNIVGAHFEELCRDWIRRFRPAELLGAAPAGPVGPTFANDPKGRQRYEIDLSLKLSDGRVVLGEAKSGVTVRVGIRELAFLEAKRDLLIHEGHVRTGQVLCLICAVGGFTSALQREAKRRSDVALVDLETIYGS